MAAKRHERTSARPCRAPSALHERDNRRVACGDRRGNSRLDEDGPLPEYALKLVLGVESHRCAIDNHLAATSENWSLARMPIVDRSILRLAAYEIMFVEDVPTSVAINEAVELAKDFGGEDDSPRFVNGVLGRIAKDIDDGPPRLPQAMTGAAPGAVRARFGGIGIVRVLRGAQKPLDEIVEAVNDKDLPLDQALSLYEEAVGLGLRASICLSRVSTRPASKKRCSEAPAGLADDSAQPAASAAARIRKVKRTAARHSKARPPLPSRSRKAIGWHDKRKGAA